ncbi:hypothetical protein C8R46DRAFT_594981 [Mycena filopes]|nr:hypothetical protein C8R46DRAFT_574326 [Mycena filopes]KAJ7180887.1 hypothetical protein C8R46DRAFT_594981 [Mycena filopes]
MLDRFPPELCDTIFRFACRDSGYTGRSLSHVSKYIRETSKLAKLQSIALIGHAEIVAFAQVLQQQTPDAHLRNTRYLLINGEPPLESAKLENIVTAKHAKWRETELESRRRMQAAAHPDVVSQEDLEEEDLELNVLLGILGREGARAITSILRDVGPTVELLDVALHRSYAAGMASEPAPFSFPRLSDLTARNGFLLHPLLQLEPFPALRRLHLVESEWSSRLQWLRDDSLSHLAPSLTHLRLSDLDEYDDDEWEPGTTLHIGGETLPSTVELVLLRPVFVAPSIYDGCPCCDETLPYREMVDSARRLRDEDPRVVLLEADADIDASKDDRYFHEWLAKAEGAECHWDMSRVDLNEPGDD